MANLSDYKESSLEDQHVLSDYKEPPRDSAFIESQEEILTPTEFIRASAAEFLKGRKPNIAGEVFYITDDGEKNLIYISEDRAISNPLIYITRLTTTEGFDVIQEKYDATNKVWVKKIEKTPLTLVEEIAVFTSFCWTIYELATIEEDVRTEKKGSRLNEEERKEMDNAVKQRIKDLLSITYLKQLVKVYMPKPKEEVEHFVHKYFKEYILSL